MPTRRVVWSSGHAAPCAPLFSPSEPPTPPDLMAPAGEILYLVCRSLIAVWWVGSVGSVSLPLSLVSSPSPPHGRVSPFAFGPIKLSPVAGDASEDGCAEHEFERASPLGTSTA